MKKGQKQICPAPEGRTKRKNENKSVIIRNAKRGSPPVRGVLARGPIEGPVHATVTSHCAKLVALSFQLLSSCPLIFPQCSHTRHTGYFHQLQLSPRSTHAHSRNPQWYVKFLHLLSSLSVCCSHTSFPHSARSCRPFPYACALAPFYFFHSIPAIDLRYTYSEI